MSETEDKANQIVWSGYPDDLTADLGKYTLRVEQMDTGRWWWATVKNDKRIGSGFEDTVENAKKASVEFYEVSKISSYSEPKY